MLRQQAVDDQLLLLATVAAGLGPKGLKGYITPAMAWEEKLEEYAPGPELTRGEERWAEVQAFTAMAGGETG
jgi:hypothetical protein